MRAIWVTIRVQWRWLMAAVVATEQECIRDHLAASQLTKTEPESAGRLRAEAQLQHEAHEGLKAVQKEIEDDHV